ncbi:Pycsar system effector family protein [Pseudomonas aeruginosa]|uniref:Pycsar system effector family protein n=1 Tax=Pseudomonas aeruginosa TaxID=287 RepID=UPI000F530C66|nr:Pycsar system effector family protein [Pseudomonas aeruginosa]EIU5493916.1 hypothetical protein [Pseudomonas aeruginosa]MBH8860130.1 hypothetical protein [Pseudomonas aeruginosa]MBI7140459.1 hypothetical protein [Pseudomonas aeruginosa]MDG4472381.1 DUF5706 domain-containing protein [Pseudomonas aeruginosa]MDP5587711.1 DUF5706 domain-containing protein [Pseudomonas aeruginosa]
MDEAKITDEQKTRISGHWDSLKRFDGYIGTANFKCGLITSLNAAVFGGVILKADQILSTSAETSKIILILLLGIVSLSALSIFWVIRSIWPNLKSASLSQGNPSLYFFASIATNFDAQRFAEQSKKYTADDIERDLAIQVHEIATITLLKMRHISTASSITAVNIFTLLTLGVLLTLKSYGIDLCKP